MTDHSHLPYRPCAGVMLANRDGRVFVGQRLDTTSEAWQMPQGGIDAGEDAEEAAIRELGEETGVHGGLVDIIARSREEYFYDLPDHLVGKMWGGQYRGQRSEEHTSELQSLMRISYAVFSLQKNNKNQLTSS